MQISVPTNFDLIILRELRGKVYDTYGSVTNPFKSYTIIPDYVLPVVSIRRLKDYVSYSHYQGVKFNYILNHPGLNPSEVIIKLLNELERIKIDIITISNSQLISYVRRNYPFEICNSVINKVDSLEKALEFKELGCNIICLDTSKNKDFEFIKLIKKETNLKLKILANNWCLLNCPYAEEHFVKNNEQALMKCLKIKLNKDINDTSFIHPDFLVDYEKIGVDFIKLGGRTRPSWWIINSTKAYLSGSYNGNAFYLMNIFGSENKIPLLIRYLILIIPPIFIRLCFKFLFSLTQNKLFRILSATKPIKFLLLLWLSVANYIYIDNKNILVSNVNKEYLLRQIDKILSF